ncbi:hypothetical protein [Nocardioides sp. GXQ0305]|uniref:hypothetical protein n=1 Tax=Nocardioides sp. GXQ0305 TaxID=3423912 RepID=UPI003D7F0DD0
MKNSALTVGAGLAALALASTATASGAYAASDGDVDVVNTETVQVYVKPDGSIESERVYEQLTLTGTGTAEVDNPIEEEGLRNLNEFGSPDVEDGVQSFEVDVDGVERLRSVSDYTGELPLDIDVEYRLDGELVEPGDVVGADGELEVLYTARNITAQPQEVSFPDGKGGTTTETVDVPIPMVGSLTTIVPPNFTEVSSDQANMAGDGKGGTKLSFTMTLFPPVGSDTAEFGYTANISDGVVPSSSVSALPVNPLESPSFKTAGESYQSGSETGVELAEGATEIDTNLLKLRDGAAKLLAGLIKLSDGADELSAGLAGEAAPGARELADGAGELNDGLGQIDDGAGQLADGAGRLADGTGQLDDGAGRLAGGAGDLATGQAALEDGLKTLHEGVDSLPKSVKKKLAKDPQYKALTGALTEIAEGIGTRMDAPDAETLLGGLNAVQYGMRFPGPTDCDVALGGGTPQRCGAMDGVQFIAEQLAQGATDLNQLKQALSALNAANACPTSPAAPDGFLPPANAPAGECRLVSTIYYGLFSPAPDAPGAQAKVTVAAGALQDIQQQVQAELLAPGAGLDRLRFGLSNPAAGNCLAAKQTTTLADDCGIKEASIFIRDLGIPSLVDGITASVRSELLGGIGQPTANCNPEDTLRCAAAALADGGAQLRAGANDLSAGTGELNAGAGELSAGAGQLADGTGEAADGSQRLADGAGELADGLGEAADGSVRLADGMAEARNGAPALVDGAGRLSEEGMSQLIDAGEDTAQDYGKLYATIEAGAERADAEKMAYGAPENATGMTAYTYELLGDDGETSRNTVRALAALGVLGLGAGGFFLYRRFAA